MSVTFDDIQRAADLVRSRIPGLPTIGVVLGSGLGAFLAAGVGPPLPDAVAAFGVFAAVFVETAHVRLEPRVEDGDPHLLQEVAHAVAPTGLLFRSAG